MLAAALTIVALLAVARLQQPALRLSAYPIDVFAYIEEKQVDTRKARLAAPELVGNLITFVYGAEGRVFYDDRFDMFPRDVSEAQLALTGARPSVFDDLARFEVDLVTVRRSDPMALILARDSAWRILYSDERWLLACLRGVEVGGTVGRC